MHEKDWPNADEISSQIIGLDQYQLPGNCNDVFDTKNENLADKEMIIVIPRIATTASLAQTWFADVMPSVPQYASQAIKFIYGVYGGLKWGKQPTGLDEEIKDDYKIVNHETIAFRRALNK